MDSGFAPLARPGMTLEKRQGADFDTLARPRVRRCGRVLERGMRGPAGASVLHRIEHLEDVGFLAPHAREPVPFVRRIIFYRVGLADASRSAPLRDDHAGGG